MLRNFVRPGGVFPERAPLDGFPLSPRGLSRGDLHDGNRLGRRISVRIVTRLGENDTFPKKTLYFLRKRWPRTPTPPKTTVIIRFLAPKHHFFTVILVLF